MAEKTIRIFGNKLPQDQFFRLLIFLFLIAALVAGVVVVQKNQEVRSKAAGTGTCNDTRIIVESAVKACALDLPFAGYCDYFGDGSKDQKLGDGCFASQSEAVAHYATSFNVGWCKSHCHIDTYPTPIPARTVSGDGSCGFGTLDCVQKNEWPVGSTGCGTDNKRYTCSGVGTPHFESKYDVNCLRTTCSTVIQGASPTPASTPPSGLSEYPGACPWCAGPDQCAAAGGTEYHSAGCSEFGTTGNCCVVGGGSGVADIRPAPTVSSVFVSRGGDLKKNGPPRTITITPTITGNPTRVQITVTQDEITALGYYLQDNPSATTGDVANELGFGAKKSASFAFPDCTGDCSGKTYTVDVYGLDTGLIKMTVTVRATNANGMDTDEGHAKFRVIN